MLTLFNPTVSDLFPSVVGKELELPWWKPSSPLYMDLRERGLPQRLICGAAIRPLLVGEVIHPTDLVLSLRLEEILVESGPIFETQAVVHEWVLVSRAPEHLIQPPPFNCAGRPGTYRLWLATMRPLGIPNSRYTPEDLMSPEPILRRQLRYEEEN
jgi:hypothetical protein